MQPEEESHHGALSATEADVQQKQMCNRSRCATEADVQQATALTESVE